MSLVGLHVEMVMEEMVTSDKVKSSDTVKRTPPLVWTAGRATKLLVNFGAMVRTQHRTIA